MGLASAGIVLATLFLAYCNGANDNPKGIATLLGSGTIGYRRALIWATVTTLAGSLLALLLARGLVATFSGRGLVPDAVAALPRFRLAVSLGAALTVILATRLGLPVSTTHALIGALIGAGGLAAAGDVRLRTLGTAFVLPLLASPNFPPVLPRKSPQVPALSEESVRTQTAQIVATKNRRNFLTSLQSPVNFCHADQNRRRACSHYETRLQGTCL